MNAGPRHHRKRHSPGLARRVVPAALFCLMLASTLFLVPATGQANARCSLPEEMQTNVPPGGVGVATKVRASFSVVDFMGVNDANQQIELDFFLMLHWQDDRLTNLAGCRIGVTEVWFPRIRMLNSQNLRQSFRNARDQVAVKEGGAVSYVQRFTGPVSSYHNLRDFPFDSHVFHLDAVAANDPENLIEFLPDADATWIAERLNIEGWNVGGVSLDVGQEDVSRIGVDVARLTLSISAERNPVFYVYRLITLLALVVAMSWVIFWVPPSQFEFQIGIGATTMLTAMAFIFAISSQLPPVGYLTILDKMVIWAIGLIFLSIVEALIAGRLVLSGKEKQAVRLDAVSRVVFPILLAGGWGALVYL